MVNIDVITIFPDIFENYLRESLIKRAQDKKLIRVTTHNLRNFTSDNHKTVDSRPFGGGLGMVIKVEPVYKAVEALKKIKGRSNKNTKVILFSPRGKKFNQKMAHRLSKIDNMILICGRYEGVDERVYKHIADMQISIGDYDLMGGELPAMVLIETVARLVPGVLAKQQLLKERVTPEKNFIEYPQYTRPEIFSPDKKINWKVPKVLLSGNHKKINEWREKYGVPIGKQLEK